MYKTILQKLHSIIEMYRIIYTNSYIYKSIYYDSAIYYHTNKTMSNVYPLQHQIDLTQLYWYMSLIQSILLWSYIIKLTHQSNNTNQYNRKQILHTVGFTIPYVLNKFTFYLLPFNSLTLQ